MRKYFFIFAALLLFMNACKQEEINPFFQEWDTPFGVPPFDKIKVEHYMPAYLAAMEEHNKEIEAIINNPEEPGFENTIVALDLSGQMLDKVRSTFSPINSANTNPEMQAVNRESSPLLTKHYNNISLNPELFNRVKKVWEKRNELDLTAPQMTLLELTYQNFVRNGANLPEEQKAELRQINERLSELSVKFGDNLLAETNNFKLVIEKEEDLAGLPDNVISAAAETAAAEGLEGKWVFTVQKPSMIPFLQYSEKRDLREKLYRGYFMRCNNDNEYDNKEIVKEIINLRVKRARMLGYATHANYVLERNMSKNPETVFHFMEQVWDAALPVAREEARAQQELIDREGGDFELASWDWWYYTEKLKKEKFNLDDEMVRPYLVMENAQQGMFDVATKLYGITFKKRTDIPSYHEEAEVFEVTDKDGSHLGLLYTDWHPRPGKRVGAWTTGFRRAHYRDGKKITPIVSVVGNFSRPTGDKPALLTFEEVETMFHEFGHALHSLFNDVPYPGLGSVPRDFVELPSQIMEHWVTEPEVLEMYAHHYETGEVIPTELVEKIREAGNFNQGFATVEYMAAAILDMEYHTLTEPSLEDVLAFEKKTMDEWGLIDEILPRYRTTYFSHIIGGYSAGYYSYSWSEQLDADAFEAFKETGDIFNQEVAARFREHVLSKGRSEDPAQLYRNFRGKDPSIEALLRNRGFID
ncbi:MAG TPA: M3 family peptidase [Bacteroidetes bacterium]|nr:M3 family peptidase [Bacteroidota bacterium]